MVIVVHSFLQGTGKSTVVSNVAALLAASGWRVGLVDGNIPSPSLHIIFGLHDQATHTLNDYLAGRCSIEQATYEVTGLRGPYLRGKLYLAPAMPGAAAPAQTIDPAWLSAGVFALRQRLQLDAVFVETHAGLGEITLSPAIMADVLVIVLSLNEQDYQGTSVSVDIMRRLNVPRMFMVVNQAPALFDSNSIAQAVEETYGCPLIASVPYSEQIAVLGGNDIFVLRHPVHPLTAIFKQMAARVTE